MDWNVKCKTLKFAITNIENLWDLWRGKESALTSKQDPYQENNGLDFIKINKLLLCENPVMMM